MGFYNSASVSVRARTFSTWVSIGGGLH